MIKTLTKEQKDNIINKLQEKGIKSVCPMCGKNHFILGDGFFNNTIQSDLKSISLGGPSIPTIPIICSNCGFISQHALGVLGLLPKEAETNNKNDEEK